jgi:glycosyltransferase involved in cell wall biosynthesis
MKDKIRILRVVGRMDRGGLETIIMNTYRAVDRAELQFDFVVHTKVQCAYDAEITSLGGRIFSVPKYLVWNHLGYVRWWNDFFRNHPEYRVVHGHMRSTASIYLRIAKKYGRTTIAHSHSTSSGKGIKAILRSTLQLFIKNYADHLLACSVPAGKWLFGKNIVNAPNFHVIPNGIDSTKFAYNTNIRAQYRKELNIDDNMVVIGNVARFHELKNHIFLLAVFQHFLKVRPNSLLLLVGDGNLKGQIIERARVLNLDSNLRMIGSRNDVHGLMQAMDILVFPSSYEGFGNVVVEAQAAGLPVIASNGVPTEVKITDLVTFVSLEAPYEQWVSAILDKLNIIARPVTTDQIRVAGFDVHNITGWYADFYKKLHNGRNSGS